MFDLDATPAQQNLATRVRDLVPELRELGAASELERKPSDALVGQILDGRFPLPTLGGVPDPVGIVLAAEEYGYADPGVALTIAAVWQSRLLLGASDATVGLATPLLYEGFGRSPAEYRTAATRTAQGWRLAGRKESVLHPGTADVSVVVARDESDGTLGVFRVEGTPPGYAVDRDDLEEGKLGLRVAHSGAVRLDAVDVPASARVDVGGVEVHRRINLARALIAAIALGTARASVDYAVDWAKERTAFGKPIASYQGVSFVLVDLASAIESSRLALWSAVTSLADSTDVVEIEAAVGRAVARACIVAADAGRQGVNVLGVHGIVTDHPVERWYRSSAALSTIDFDPITFALEVV